MMERALVVGATGFIGSRIVAALAASDIEVVGMRRWNSDPGRVAALGVPTVVGDLLDRDRLVEVLPGHNYVFMAAAPDIGLGEQAYLRESALGMRNLLSVCRQVDVERVIVTSCATTLARPTSGAMSTAQEVYLPGSPLEDEIRAPEIRRAHHRAYAQYAAELECFRQAADGLDLTLLCPGICIGDQAVLPARQLLGKLPDQARLNLVDVDDVARAHVKAVKDSGVELFSGELFPTRRLALGGDNTTVGELYKRLEPAGSGERYLGRYDIRLSEDPDELRTLHQFGANLWLDSSRAEHRLGFRSRSL